MTTKILILRHAEKPAESGDNQLSWRGRARAAALAAYLPQAFGRPDYLYAASDSVESHRSRLTLTPLSLALGVPIDSTFENERYGDLAKQLLSKAAEQSSTIYVCWHHGNIPELAKVLGARSVPDNWEDDVFDRIWRIRLGGDQADLEKIHQRLMFGDSQD